MVMITSSVNVVGEILGLVGTPSRRDQDRAQAFPPLLWRRWALPIYPVFIETRFSRRLRGGTGPAGDSLLVREDIFQPDVGIRHTEMRSFGVEDFNKSGRHVAHVYDTRGLTFGGSLRK